MKRDTVIILVGIIVVAAGLRLYGLDSQSLWYDEVIEEKAFQMMFLTYNPRGIPQLNTPPLNALFIYLAGKISPGSEFALRMVPFSFGLISVPLLFLLGRRLFNENVGLAAAFLLAVSPFHIWYSQDARMYSLQWMLALISMIYFVQALERPNWQNYVGYLISTAAGLYTHQLTVFLIILQGMYVLLFFQKYKAHFFRWVGIFSITIVLYLPWIIYTIIVYTDTNWRAGFSKEVDLKVFPYTIYSFCAGFSIGPSLREFHLNQSLTVIKPYLAVMGLLMIVYGALFMLGIWSVWKDRSKFLLLLFFMAVPIIGVFMLNKIMPSVTYNVRYVGPALFAFLLFIAKGIEWLSCLKSRIYGIVLTVFAISAVMVFSSYAYFNYQFDKKYAKPDIREAVVYIKENRITGDAVLCIADKDTFNRYSRGNFGCSGLSAADLDKEKIEAEVQAAVEGEKRLWLVLNNEWYADRLGYAKAWLDSNYEEIKQFRRDVTEIANVRIYCYDLIKKKTVPERIT